MTPDFPFFRVCEDCTQFGGNYFAVFNPINGRGVVFYPPLNFLLNISQTVWARILKFSDFS